MKKIPMVLLLGGFIAISSPALAAELSRVTTNAPDLNCVYDPLCVIDPVTDTSDVIDFPDGAGTGFLQSRTFIGQVGTPADGLFGYQYRIDLREMAGILAVPCAVTLTVDFGPIVPLDYNGDGEPEHVYVITTGGLGTVGPDFASQTGNRVSFHFYGGTCAGESSFFFGMTSRNPPRAVTGQITESLTAEVFEFFLRAPIFPLCPPRPDLNDDLTPVQRDVLDDLLRNYVTEPVIHDHFTPGIHSTTNIFPWHRTYIGGLENDLILQGHPEFVPLPKWDPAKPIPAEFQSIDPDCFLSLDPGNCNALGNTNPNKPRPAHLVFPALCDYATRDELVSGGVDPARPGIDGGPSFHGGVHCTIGGNMCTFRSPAAEIFWEWHAFIDDIWAEWECRCQGLNSFTIAPLPEDLLTPCLITPCWILWLPLDDPRILDPFELELRTFIDIRGSENTAFPSGDPVQIAGMVGGALSFDGVDDFLRVADDPELAIGPLDMSIDAWIRTSVKGIQPIVEKLDAAAGVGFSLYLQDGHLAFMLATPGAAATHAVAPPTTVAVADGEWHHVAVTVDRDQVRGGRMFVDGKVAHTFDPTISQGDVINTAELLIGRGSPTQNDPDGSFFSGAIDELDIFRRVLKPDEVAGIYGAGEAGKLGALPSVKQLVFPEICSSQAFGESGQTAIVPIVLNNGAVAGYQVDLSFDPSILTPVGVQLGADTAAAVGWTVTSQIVAPGTLRVLGFSDPPTDLAPVTNEVALVEFNIVAAAPAGPTPLSQSNCVLSDHEGLAIPCELCPDPGGVVVRNASSYRFGPIPSPVGVDVFNPLPFPVTVEALDSFGNQAPAYAGVAEMTVTDAACTNTIQPGTLSISNGVGADTFTVNCCLNPQLPSTSTALILQAADPPFAISGESDPVQGVAKGDVDASGGVDVLDVTRTVRLSLNQAVAAPPPTSFQFWAAGMPDQLCTVDAGINVLDVVRVKNKALGLPDLCPCTGPVFESAAVAIPAQAIGVSLVREKRGSFLLMIEGAQDLGGLQLDLRGVGRNVSVTLEGMTAGQSWQLFTQREKKGNRLEVLMFSNATTGVTGDGPVLRITGPGNPRLNAVIVSDARGREIPMR